MLKYLNYERLKNITKTVKPYRGSTNRFPIGRRTQNTKFFLVENDETGEEVYRIVYGYCHNSEEITKEEYEAAKSAGDKDVSEYTWYNPVQYKRHTKIPHQLGIVRSDNTFEFNNTNGYYGQDSNMLLSRWSAGYFYSSSRHGGMVYRERRTNADGFGQHYLFHPIFDGMRIHWGRSWGQRIQGQPIHLLLPPKNIPPDREIKFHQTHSIRCCETRVSPRPKTFLPQTKYRRFVE